jgi:hypothetical protein
VPEEVGPRCRPVAAATRATGTLGEVRVRGSDRGAVSSERQSVGSVIKKRRKRMAKKKHRKLLKKTRVQRRRQGK